MLNRSRVVIVESDPAKQTLLLRALRESGVSCSTVATSSPREAEERIQTLESELPRLLLVGARVCDDEVLSLVRSVRGSARTVAVPIVIVSDVADKTAVRNCYASGVNSFLVVPPDEKACSEMLAAVADCWLRLNLQGSGGEFDK